MAVLKRTSSMLFFFILVGGLVGGLMGEVLLLLSPTGFLKNVFLKSYDIGITPPFTFDLHLFTFTIGFTLRMNLLSILGMILGIYTYKQA